MELFKKLLSKDDQVGGGNSNSPEDLGKTPENSQEQIPFKGKILLVYRDNPYYQENISKFKDAFVARGAQVNIITVPPLNEDDQIAEFIQQNMVSENDLVMTDKTCARVVNNFNIDVDTKSFRDDLDMAGKFFSIQETCGEAVYFEKDPNIKLEYLKNNLVENYKKHFEIYKPDRVIIDVQYIFDHMDINHTGLKNLYIEKNNISDEDLIKNIDHESDEFRLFTGDFIKENLIKIGIPKEKISIVDNIFKDFHGNNPDDLSAFMKQNFTAKDWVVCDGHVMRPKMMYVKGISFLEDFKENESFIESLQDTYPHIVSALDINEDIRNQQRYYGMISPNMDFEEVYQTMKNKVIDNIILDFNKSQEEMH